MKTDWMSWVVMHWYALIAIPLVLAGVAVILVLVRQKHRTGAWKFFSLMMGGWPAAIDDWEENATPRSGRFVVVGLIIMVALVIGAILYT